MDQPILRIGVFSDLHVMVWRDTEAPVPWVPTLEHALADAAELGPDLLVLNGDLTNGKERDYRLAMRLLRQRCPQVETAFTMGNHEYYGYWEEESFSPDLARERFRRWTGQEAHYHERRLGGATLLFLSTEDYTPDMKDAGYLSPRQLAWFEERLIAAPPGPVLTFFHQPVNGTVADSEATCLQSDQLRAILAKRPGTLFFSGHTHARMDRPDQLLLQDSTLFVGGGALCTPHPQSRWVELYGDRLVLRLRDHLTRQWLPEYDHTVLHG